MKPFPFAILVLLGGLPTLPARAGEPADEPGLPPPRRIPAAARLADVEEVRKRLGLLPEYERVPGIEGVRVAVLDYGFAGIDGVRPYLPANAVVVEHYDPDFVRRWQLGDPEYRKGFAPGNHHGRVMAQIVWAVTGLDPRGPKFYLLNANGPTMLRRAVRYAIEQRVDVILFCSTFDGGGNGDGRGPINRIVSEAVAAGILWVNAAGNHGKGVFNGPVLLRDDGYLSLGGGQDSTALRFRNLLDENTVSVTLTWNDYREEEDAGTLKDLDLYVEDADGRLLAAGEKRQVAGDREPGPDESRNPREKVVLPDLPAAPDRDYRIRVRARSGSFDRTTDRIRVLVTASREGYVDPKTGTPADALQFLDASGSGEIYPPADHPLVLTVGDASPASSVGPTADHRVKPDVVLADSQAAFTNGEVSAGASNAAAYFAGVVAVLKAAEPRLETRHLLSLARRTRTVSVSRRAEPQPAEGREISLEQARRIHHGLIIDRVREAVGQGRVRARLTADRRLVLEVEGPPARLRALFPRFPARLLERAAEFEYYLSLRHDARRGAEGLMVHDQYRRKDQAEGRREPYPWETGDTALRSTGRVQPFDFVEVRQAEPEARADEPVRATALERLWRTPTRRELAEAVRTQRAEPLQMPRPLAPRLETRPPLGRRP